MTRSWVISQMSSPDVGYQRPGHHYRFQYLGLRDSVDQVNARRDLQSEILRLTTRRRIASRVLTVTVCSAILSRKRLMRCMQWAYYRPLSSRI